ncbi:hypothetical protein B4064_3076 [Caldibacillus thermoamylovorans]|uniref:Uncharacterized protein n=1 Tax=Caldibacillus thermoamylovorans TaxID=35841 RepID=A0ABD4A9H4_9BACI|nr:hypothetical protein B4064_3076 [Caldibacillus thermoamylovorans]KIO73736.1 hypothetical protein B4167_0307 [Caldibacillus thermoamylovorans]
MCTLKYVSTRLIILLILIVYDDREILSDINRTYSMKRCKT